MQRWGEQLLHTLRCQARKPDVRGGNPPGTRVPASRCNRDPRIDKFCEYRSARDLRVVLDMAHQTWPRRGRNSEPRPWATMAFNPWRNPRANSGGMRW